MRRRRTSRALRAPLVAEPAPDSVPGLSALAVACRLRRHRPSPRLIGRAPASSRAPPSACAGSRTAPCVRVRCRAGGSGHLRDRFALHSRPPNRGRFRRALPHRAGRHPVQFPLHMSPAQSPRRLRPAGSSGGDFYFASPRIHGYLDAGRRLVLTPERTNGAFPAYARRRMSRRKTLQ